eukprot:932755-Pyramimonas_sp.AAC.1
MATPGAHEHHTRHTHGHTQRTLSTTPGIPMATPGAPERQSQAARLPPPSATFGAGLTLLGLCWRCAAVRAAWRGGGVGHRHHLGPRLRGRLPPLQGARGAGSDHRARRAGPLPAARLPHQHAAQVLHGHAQELPQDGGGALRHGARVQRAGGAHVLRRPQEQGGQA